MPDRVAGHVSDSCKPPHRRTNHDDAHERPPRHLRPPHRPFRRRPRRRHLDRPDPCPDWTVADVVDHVVDTQRDFLDQHGLGNHVDLGPRPSGDPAEVWAAQRAAVLGIGDDVLHREYAGYFGPTTVGATLADFYGFDLLVHRWDIGRAVGREVAFDDAELDDLQRSIATFGDNLYAPGICAPALPVPDDAPRQTRVLALLGRRA